MYKSLFFLFLISACNACTPRLDKSDDSQVQENPYPWEECSQHIEEHPCNFTLVDQHGNDVSLYDFYKQPIVLDFSVMWCGPCISFDLIVWKRFLYGPFVDINLPLQ